MSERVNSQNVVLAVRDKVPVLDKRELTPLPLPRYMSLDIYSTNVSYTIRRFVLTYDADLPIPIKMPQQLSKL